MMEKTKNSFKDNYHAFMHKLEEMYHSSGADAAYESVENFFDRQKSEFERYMQSEEGANHTEEMKQWAENMRNKISGASKERQKEMSDFVDRVQRFTKQKEHEAKASANKHNL